MSSLDYRSQTDRWGRTFDNAQQRFNGTMSIRVAKLFECGAEKRVGWIL